MRISGSLERKPSPGFSVQRPEADLSISIFIDLKPFF